MKIDIHTHIMPERVPNWFEKWGYGDFIRLEHHHPGCARMIKGDKTFREIEENCWSPDVRMKEMDMTQVNVQVLSTIPVLFNYWAKPEHGHDTSRFFNDHIARCCDLRPTRFIGLGTLPMQDIYFAIKEMERCVNDLRLPGIEIGSNINGKNLGDPYFDPFWQAAEEMGCCIFVHPWEMMGEKEMEKYWLPWLVGMPAETARAICSMIFAGVLERYPRLRVAFAHGAGSFPFTIGRIEHGFNVRPDLVAMDNNINPRDYLGRFWLDSLTHDAKALDYIVEMMGGDKVCMGSDYPFPLGEHHPGKLIESMENFSASLTEQLLYKNALSWLDIKEDRFTIGS
jgi:aminocarboxymuconate-semialdehyde decarboxylase